MMLIKVSASQSDVYSATLTAMAPLESELADIENAIRQAKETLRECRIKASENDATIKRLVQTFVEQAAS